MTRKQSFKMISTKKSEKGRKSPWTQFIRKDLSSKQVLHINTCRHLLTYCNIWSFYWCYSTTKQHSTFGVISIVRKRRKLACGVRLCSFFSSWTSHCGAKCTFFSITQRPDFVAELIALSAWLKPSADPTTRNNPTSKWTGTSLNT